MDTKKEAVSVVNDGSSTEGSTPAAGETTPLSPPDPGLAKSLQSRHLIFFSLGSSIGLGLWLGSGATLAKGGPVSNVLGFLLAGLISWAVAQAVGEMACNYPIPSAFPRWTEKFLDKAPAFALGWAYWMSSTLVLAAEIQGACNVIRYWTDSLHVSVWVTIFLAIILFVNIFHVKVFGEVEFVASIIKFFWIFVVIIMFIVITAGGAPNHTTTGFRYWRETPFINGFKGFLNGLHNCIFSMAGTEFIGLTAAEARNPRKSVPRAVNTIWIRLGLFYIGGSFVTTLCVDPRDHDLFGASGTNASPFVIAMLRAGLPNAAHVMNAIILLSVLSCGNALAYASSRTPIGLAQIGMAPKIFLKTDSKGRPWPSIIMTFVIGGGISYLNATESSYEVYAWLAHLVGLCALFNWSMLFTNHIRFRKAWKTQGYTKADLPWATKYFPWSSFMGLGLCLLLVVNEFYLAVWPLGLPSSAKNFFSKYVSIIVIGCMYIGAKIYFRGPLYLKSDQVDLISERRIYSAEDLEEGDEKRTFATIKDLVTKPMKKIGN
ncbi:hypothetical protein AYO20_08497 [Fonsecaea nubica]|uniref:Amino acid permease/ SLC12A domain-containing protein n=1 Tax=Fonsecaea nubica TaxID=856822 RepID=A0A178CP52_9EURO|nr:hypothetical protein AYO20_08497 [Fonsecaea nubica]OAL30912.1 hypothetical protein AYO20_08497 [Fonsecaea nubica]